MLWLKPCPMGSPGIISPLQSMAQAMPDGQSWHHFTHSVHGSSHARRAVLAVGGLDDDVAAGVHHERSLPLDTALPLDTGGACACTEGDDAEGVHQALAEGDDTESGEVRVPEDAAGVVRDLAVCRGGGGVRVREDAEGVVHDLAAPRATLDTALPLDATRATLDAIRATLDTALVRFLR